jgi:transcriptional regulator with XRE-family HTH domain
MPVEPLYPIGAEILRLRQERGLSLRDVAERTGLNYTRIREWEKGVNNANGRPVIPPFEAILKLAKAYGVKPEPLLELAGYTPLGRLDELEQKLVDRIRALSHEQRMTLLTYLENLTNS